ncbi:LANO_0H09978g1_1 [Lachancea nothofagi CBS 11611]|uniref:LANO_0H09978g1_1 n=1 Tax=Lachancea nothofagi CBS 11611 TaxID=1266666 RepID=A0A1G4KM48_9SACH|nr:LANO_0H09978g1_1 [Lachancea nothofagi CBS 11611]
MVTNTVIITSAHGNAAGNEILEQVREFLETIVLTRFTVTAAHPMQLVALPALHRSVLVCPTHETAQNVVSLKRQWPKLDQVHFQFSMVDAASPVGPTQYLELPQHEATFLISPPTSPPPEFDYSRLEESPNKHKGLWPSCHVPSANDFPGVNPSESGHGLPEGHHVLLTTSNASITLDSVSHDGDSATSTTISNGPAAPEIARFRTAVPPRSIFDDVE